MIEIKCEEKMTFDEFKAALEAADYPFEIWGFEGILNELILVCRKACDDSADNTLRSWYTSRADILHDILEDRGYFNT